MSVRMCQFQHRPWAQGKQAFGEVSTDRFYELIALREFASTIGISVDRILLIGHLTGVQVRKEIDTAATGRRCDG